MDFADPRLAKLKGKLPARKPATAPSTASPATPRQPSASTVQVRTITSTEKVLRPPAPSRPAALPAPRSHPPALDSHPSKPAVPPPPRLPKCSLSFSQKGPQEKARREEAEGKKRKAIKGTVRAQPVKKAKWAGSTAHGPGDAALRRPISSPLAASSAETEQDSSSGEEADVRREDQDGCESRDAVTSAARRAERSIVRSVARDSMGDTAGDGADDGAKAVSAEELVMRNRAAFKKWFRASGDRSDHRPWPADGSDPIVELVYPGGGRERFPLLVPKVDDDEYRPLDDIYNVIRTTLAHFLTPNESLDHFSEPHPIASRTGGAASAFAFLSVHSSTPRASRSPSVLPSDSATGTPDPRTESLSDVPLLKALERARRRQDGPRFAALVQHFNSVVQELRASGAMRHNIGEMPGLRRDVWDGICKQAYERRVGPHVDELRKYESWSDNVYGELRPAFVSDLAHLTRLGPGSVLVDLGSGVGNCVVQAALEAGCTAVGFENMDTASSLAAGQSAEIAARARMWGVAHGAIHLHPADFTASPAVNAWLRRADVVLVNNQVFTPKLNEQLTLLFLDLRDGTQVVSLKPFVPKEFRVTARTRESPLAILEQGAARRYARGSVSWTGEGGTFYIATVDRSRLGAPQR